MGPSRILVAPGLRTPARMGWRGGVATAVAVVVAQPSLWLLGALGYLLRGGIVVLTMAIIVLPSPVAVRLMLGDHLGSSGLTPSFFALAGVAGAILLVTVLVALLLIAFVEAAAFERFLASGHGPVASRGISRASRPPRRRLIGALFAVQLFGLLVILLAAAPLAVAATQATYNEIIRPNLAGGALYDRVLAQLAAPAFLFLVALGLVEMWTAVASRRLLIQAHGLTGGSTRADRRPRPPLRLTDALAAIGSGLVRPLLRPLSAIPTALLGWLATLGVLVPAVWALGLAWRGARYELLASQPLDGRPATALVASVVLVAAWLASLAVAGFASAVRAALWTSEELR